MNKATFGIAFLLGGTFLGGAAYAQCPAKVGQNTGCGTVITIDGVNPPKIQNLQGPYDGSDDTLVGIVNNIPVCTGTLSLTQACGIPIVSLDLSSTTDIFGFDGDGIQTFGVQGNEANGYGGPNVYYSNISADKKSGRVNFITAVPPGGGTAFFSLEEQLKAATGCTNLLNNSVPRPTLWSGNTGIGTTFTPVGNDPATGQPWKLDAAATACGFIGWDWQQTITQLPTPLPTDANGNIFFADALSPKTAPAVPFNDPLPNDYFYATLSGGTQPPLLRVYYNPIDPATKSNSLAAHLSPGNTLATATSMAFFDRPADPCLTDAGGGINSSASANALCGGAGAAKRAPAGQTINFTTRLVGLQGRFPGAAVVDTGIGFTWTTTYNGTSGGLAILRNDTNRTDDPGGTGGVTITGYTPTTTYNGVNVSALNGSTTVGGPTNLLAAVLPASRSAVVNGTATAFATIINSGAATAPGCSIALATGQPVTFHYQTTDPKTNAVTGKIDTPVDIPAGAAQSFVIALTPTAAIAPTDVPFTFTCANTAPAPVNVGLNTLLFSASATQPPDVVALAATVTNDGVLHIPGNNGTGAFSVATVNVGVAATITASANTGSAKLPVALTICQTNPSNGQCLAPPAATVTASIAANATPTFSIFGAASNAIAFDPANSRIFVNFAEGNGTVRGATSVAVTTQ